MSQTACNFFPSTKRFFCKHGRQRILFLKEVLCFHKPHVSLNTRLFESLALTGFFSSLRFLLFRKHTDSPIVGASDMSQVSTYPFSRHKPIIWSLSRTLEGDMSQGCSLGPPASGGPINRHNSSNKGLNIHLV